MHARICLAIETDRTIDPSAARKAGLFHAPIERGTTDTERFGGAGGGRQQQRRGADLRYATLSEANLTGANLTNANMTSTNLTVTNMENANLSGAILKHFYEDDYEYGFGCPGYFPSVYWVPYDRTPSKPMDEHGVEWCGEL